MKNTHNPIPRGPCRHALRAFLAAMVAAVSLVASAADADVVAQAEKLVRAGRYADAYQLLEPLETKLAGDLKFDYLLARAALESGRPSKASFIYERILAVEPSYVGVRLEMGRAYLALGDYARAKLELETVLRFENLPPDLRAQAQIYAAAAEQYLVGRKTVGYGYMEYAYGYDSNPLSATAANPIPLAGGQQLILPPAARERSDHYQALSGGGELSHSVSGSFSVYAGGDARARYHNNIDAADFRSLDLRAGIGYSGGRTNARVGVVGGRYWLDDTKTRDTYGVITDWRYLVSNEDQLNVSVGAARFRYLPALLEVNDYDLYQGAVGWLRAVSNGRGAIGLALSGGTENATQGRVDGDKAFFGVRVTWQNALTDRIGGFFLAGGQSGKYSETNPAFATTRRDTLYDVTAGVTWSFARGWSLRPQVVYLKNDSNISLFEFDRTDVSVNLRVDF